MGIPFLCGLTVTNRDASATEAFPGAARWRKSSHSDGTGGDCVEVADGLVGIVPVGDSKRPHEPAVIVTAGAWVPFVRALKAGKPSG
ncbi:DUF397 domain-containing protein [Streptomyces sp. NPDC006463]|uniref:DUF397 domain-containing protein n=1 Tax=Streptomyces sp. NPDC006463 TaxID=3364746 RepID=UPI0036841A39